MSDKKIKVLVASPADVAEERNIAETVIRTWHIRHRSLGITLEPVLWESHGAPECGDSNNGDRVQGILNKQIVDECDCAIGIFWTRIGTDTGVAPGGAVEEVQRLMSKGKPVMLYFSELPMPRKVDIKQVEQVDVFRESVQSHALTWKYYDYHQFESLLLKHLDIQIPRWFGPEATVQDKIVVPPELDAASAIKLYQSTLKRQLGNINLTGSPAITNFSVRLSDTFVSLSLSGASRCETQPLSGEDSFLPQKENRASTPEEVMSFVFQSHPLLLVIGDPGSGKTTLLKYYALSCLDNGRYTEFGFSELVNVFYLPLRELKKDDFGYASLPASLAAWCAKNYLALPDTHFSGWLEQSSTLILLDGLDEISDVYDRIAVCDWVDKMVCRFTMAKFVVTSRSTGYRKGDGIELEASHLRTDIMDFSKEQQAQFLCRWFKAAFIGELPHGNGNKAEWHNRQEQTAAKKAEAILEFLAQDKNRSLRSLAGIPLLLQIMAMLWKDREYLPASRLKLYDAALNYMLDYRDRRKGIFPLLVAEDARRVLSPVSLWMQEELKKDEADREMMQQQMQVQLNTLYNSLPASDFCRNLVDRAGVLVEYGSTEYVFRHKSFREYMAGVQLVKNIHKPDALNKLVRHFGDDWWTEVFRFFIAHLEDAELFDSFMLKLFNSSFSKELNQKQQDLLVTLVEEAPQRKIDALQKKLLNPKTTLNRQRYLLLCLRTIGKPEALDAVKKFIDTPFSKHAAVVNFAREIAGVTEQSVQVILHDGHNREQASTLFDKLGAQYILIKGGTFTYSVTGEPTTMPDLYVAKYTMTNKLYRLFISYLRSQMPEYEASLPLSVFTNAITDIAKRNVWDKGFGNYLSEGKEELASLFRSKRDEDRKFGGDDQPVVSITWYAARAYCLWLSLLETEGRDTDIYSLPTEQEWEFAAVGSEGRQYPWGNPEPTNKLANYNQNEGATTQVGRYPDGATPEGLYDMAGNVWEWMNNIYDKNTQEEYFKSARALRGGSWDDGPDSLRCSARGSSVPASAGNVIGFRVVCSSPSS
jgi:formylglycine-generating enzyme required for sulfatase activity